MTEFAKWFIKQMRQNGYECPLSSKAEKYFTLSFVDTGDTKVHFQVLHVTQEMSPSAIKAAFEVYECPVLFVVDVLLLPMLMSEIKDWLRALHAVYYGRVYVWDGQTIRAIHYNWTEQHTSISDPISTIGILFTRTECQLRDFPSTFYIARFYDRAFWKEQAPPKQKKEPPKERADKWREEWEQATKGYAEQSQQYDTPWAKKPPTQEDINEAFKRAFNEYQSRVDWDAWNHVHQRSAPVGDKWLSVLMATGSIEAARKKFKELAKQYHPDLNPGDATALATMQEISNAFDKVKEYLR